MRLVRHPWERIDGRSVVGSILRRLGGAMALRGDEPLVTRLREVPAHGEVVLAHDEWSLTEMVTIDRPCTLRGAGRATTLRWTQDVSAALKVTSDDVTIENLRIVTDQTITSGVWLTGASRVRLRNVIIEGCASGVLVADCVDFGLENVTVLGRTSIGIYVASTGLHTYVPASASFSAHNRGNCRFGRILGCYVEMEPGATYATMDALTMEQDVSHVVIDGCNFAMGDASYYNTPSSPAGSLENVWGDNVLEGTLTVS